MRSATIATVVGCFLISSLQTDAKVFTHCELAQELRRLQIPESQIATWVCIAHYESRLNSSAISGTGDHGIFQISEEYWCSPPGRGKGCGATCAEFEDDNITDDVDCVQTIFEEHQGLSGNGFNAWAVYPRCKKSSNANRFIKKCTAGSIDNSIDSSDIPVDLRFANPSYSSAPRTSYSSHPSYTSNQDFSKSSYTSSQGYSKSSSPYSQDFSKSSYPSIFQTSLSPIQDLGLIKTSVIPFSQGYDYSARHDPFSYTTRKPTQIISSSTVSPSHAILSYNPSIYSSSKPSSYSVGSIYYNPFETKSTTAAPVLYSFNPRKSFSTSSFGNSRTVFGYKSTPAQQVYHQAYTTSNPAVVKTSSPAPPLKGFKAPWADFPWWNGGK